MGIEFRITTHSYFPEKKIVEILVDGKCVGVIYPSEEKGIRIASAHISDTTPEKDFAGEVIEYDGTESWPPIPSVRINFKPSPYIIQDGKLVKLSSK
jgi:hypothetical protein